MNKMTWGKNGINASISTLKRRKFKITWYFGLKSRHSKMQTIPQVATIRSTCAVTPASDLRNMINACKLRNVENIGDLAIFIQESKNQSREPPDLPTISKSLKKMWRKGRIQKINSWEVNGWEECDKAIIHSKELSKTEMINAEIMQLSLEKQLAEAREEKCDLEKTYHYAVHEIPRTLRKIM